MTTAQQWLDLAERIEAATGADRDIDLAIARLLGVTILKRNNEDTANYETTYWEYTASLDAAMTLVPDGWDGVLYLATEYTMPCAQLETPAMRARFSMDYEAATGEAVTLPLALCAAACRARAGMEG